MDFEIGGKSFLVEGLVEDLVEGLVEGLVERLLLPVLSLALLVERLKKITETDFKWRYFFKAKLLAPRRSY